jgi:hypothetical protein
MVAFPSSLTAGETLISEIPEGAYGSVFAIFVGPAKRQENFTLLGEVFKLSVQTQAWLPGDYAVELWGVSPMSRVLLCRTRLVIFSSISSQPVTTAYDPRSRAERMIEKVESMLEGNASEGVRRYKINNRELERYSITELMELLSYWKKQFQLEVRKARGASPLGPKIVFTL